MVSGLTVTERQWALVTLLVLAVVGLAMAAGGRGDPLGVHGFIVLIYSVGLAFVAIMAGYYAPEPDEARLSHYYDDPIRFGIVLTMAWAVFGMAFGVWVAALLAWPDLTFDAAWASFGRIRPVHTTGIIFGFGGNALITTSLHVLQRTSRARLPDQFSPWFVLLGYNLFCILAVTGYFMGITQSKEYAEPEWYADIWLVIVWVVYFAIYIRTLARRKEPHIYVANWSTWPSSWWWRCCTSSTTGGADLLGLGQELFAVLRRAGRDDAMVVRPQRRRLLPDRRLPRHDVLLHAQARGAADLLLPAVHHQLLGHHLPLHVGGLAPPALHGAAAMGADAGHDLLRRAAGAVLGFGRQCAGDAQRRLAQGPRRRHAALHDGGGGVLRPVHLRRLVHGHPPGQLAVALHRLDRGPCPCRRAGLGGDDNLRLDLRAGAVDVEARGHVFAQAGRGPLLARPNRLHRLRLRDVELGHHPGPDVAHL